MNLVSMGGRALSLSLSLHENVESRSEFEIFLIKEDERGGFLK